MHGAKPPVWRRLELPLTLVMVHEVMQIAFAWHGCHLHQFETACGAFGRPDDDDWGFEDVGDESAVALVQVAAEEKAKIVYVYDFGDDWRHDIVVEKITPALPGVAYPRCTGGPPPGFHMLPGLSDLVPGIVALRGLHNSST